MSIGKTILDLPLAVTLEDTMKIPTGGFGDQTVELSDLRDYLVGSKHVYVTSDPALLASNGTYQKLVLESSGVLSCQMESGSFVFLKVTSGFDLDLSNFRLVKPFVVDPRFESAIVLFNMFGVKFAMGLSYVPSAKSNPDPEYWDTVVYLPMTSTTYPQLIEDAMQLTGNVIGGNLRQTLKNQTQPLEAITLSLTATDSELRQILKTQTQPLEAITLGITATDGELRQILKSQTQPIEAITLGITATDSELKTVLITHNYGLEAISLGITALDGDLTIG